MFEENYRPKITDSESLKAFITGPIWSDMCDWLEYILIHARTQLENPEVAPDYETVQYLRGEIFSMKYFMEMPSMMLEEMKRLEVEEAQIGQEEDFNDK